VGLFCTNSDIKGKNMLLPAMNDRFRLTVLLLHPMHIVQISTPDEC